MLIVAVIAIVFLIVISLLMGAIDSFKNSRLKSLLDYCDPNTKQTQVSVDSAINANIEYVTKQAKRIMPCNGSIEISVTSFVTEYKTRDPFLVHDMLHSSVKYLSFLANKTNFRLVYDKRFVIRRKTASGVVDTLDTHKDQLLALCIHWFIWNYSSNPYALDQSFKKISASTNLLYGRMYGYHDYKSYDCSIECWEKYTPTWEYSDGVTKGMEVTVERSKKKHVYVNIMDYASEQALGPQSHGKFQLIEEILLLMDLEERTENAFYQIIPKLLRKACFTIDSKKMRNQIAPYGVEDDWGDNFDAWFFLSSIFLTCRMLSKDTRDKRVMSERDDFLRSCQALSVKPKDLNLDRFSFEALGGITVFNSELSYETLYKKLEPYIERRFSEVLAEIQKTEAFTETIEFTSVLALWSYLLFGTYIHISIWNRMMANTAINMAIEAIVEYSNGHALARGTRDDQFDPTHN